MRKYKINMGFFDNCVFEEVDEEDSIIDDDRYKETGKIICEKPIR